MDIQTVFKGKNKKVMIAGGVIAGGFVFYEYRKRSTAAAAAVATTDPTATSSTDTTGYNSSDLGYGTVDSGYSAAPSGNAIGYGYVDPSTGATITNGSSQLITGPTTNAAWAQTVEAYLSTMGTDPQKVAAAIGHYLSGAALANNDELIIVQEALALEGPPPVAVPAPHLAATAGQTNTNPATNPKLTGISTTIGSKYSTPSLHISSQRKGVADLAWSNPTGGNAGTDYVLRFQGKALRSMTGIHSAQVTTNGTYTIQATQGGHASSNVSNSVTVKGI
jgi:hypothetical protein